jgi:hypothetical protein
LVFLFALLFAFSAALCLMCRAQDVTNLDTDVKGSREPYFGTDSGVANAYVITTVAPLGPSLRTGSCVEFYAAHANTAASTLKVDGGSVIAVKKNVSAALVSGDIQLNGWTEACYDGTNFQLVGNGSFSTVLIACPQLPAFTGDVTTPGASCTTTLTNIPDGVTMAGKIVATAIAAPATPASGKANIYVDSTQKMLAAKNDAGQIGYTVIDNSGSTHNFVTSIVGGVVSTAQPADSDISFSDITTGNAATTQHGFLKKLDNTATHYMDGTGNWSTPAGGGGGGGGTCSTIGLVGTPTASSGFSGTSVTPTITCTGSLIVIGVTSASSATNPPTVTSCASVPSWSLIKSSVVNSNFAWLYGGYSTGTGSCSISTNVTCAGWCFTVQGELANTKLPADQTKADYSNGTSSINTSLPALANTNDIVVSLLGGFHTGWTASPTAPLTSIVASNASNLAWYQATSASAQSFNWGITCCGSTWWNDNVILNAAFPTSTTSAVFYQTEQVDGVTQTQEQIDDLVSGPGISISGADDSANTRTKRTVSLVTPVTVANGGTGTSTPSLVGGTSVSITGTWPNQTVSFTGSGATPGYVFLEGHTASNSASLDFTTCFSSTYDDYQIRVTHLIPATSGANVLMLAHAGGVYDTASNYTWVGFRQSAAGSANNVGSNSTTSFGLDVSGGISNSTTTGSFRATIDLSDPLGATGYPSLTDDASDWDGTANAEVIARMSGSYKSTTAMDGFRIKASSGNLTSGVVRCYGIAH